MWRRRRWPCSRPRAWSGLPVGHDIDSEPTDATNAAAGHIEIPRLHAGDPDGVPTGVTGDCGDHKYLFIHIVSCGMSFLPLSFPESNSPIPGRPSLPGPQMSPNAGNHGLYAYSAVCARLTAPRLDSGYCWRGTFRFAHWVLSAAADGNAGPSREAARAGSTNVGACGIASGTAKTELAGGYRDVLLKRARPYRLPTGWYPARLPPWRHFRLHPPCPSGLKVRPNRCVATAHKDKPSRIRVRRSRSALREVVKLPKDRRWRRARTPRIARSSSAERLVRRGVIEASRDL